MMEQKVTKTNLRMKTSCMLTKEIFLCVEISTFSKEMICCGCIITFSLHDALRVKKFVTLSLTEVVS